MKTVLTKTLVLIAGGALVLPFVAAAVLVGARAVAGADGGKSFLLAVGLALVWTLFGGVKGFAQNGADGREGHELLVAPRRGEARRHAFLDIRGL
ncbi:MAG: hypothetical protein LC795_03025 [Acidobacteria bacterium]|nr:hypothetical protein [Acidobacteriota bacterium]